MTIVVIDVVAICVIYCGKNVCMLTSLGALAVTEDSPSLKRSDSLLVRSL